MAAPLLLVQRLAEVREGQACSERERGMGTGEGVRGGMLARHGQEW